MATKAVQVQITESAKGTQMPLLAEMAMKQALTGPDSEEWMGVIVFEFKSIIAMGTYVVVYRPSEEHVIENRIER